MTVSIAPFTPAHLDAAADLLAARHRRGREGQPTLAPRFVNAIATRPLLETLLAGDRTKGVTALDDGAG